jgi:hypothetical protein
MGPDLLGELTVATNAVGLKHFGIPGLDADGFLEILERESLGMMVPVAGLHEELMDDIVVGQMAVVANSVRMVGGMPPVVVLLAHVRETLGCDECVHSRTQEGSNQDADRDAQKNKRLLDPHDADSCWEWASAGHMEPDTAQINAVPPKQEN